MATQSQGAGKRVKLTSAEYMLLSALTGVQWERMPLEYLRPQMLKTAKRLKKRGLLDRRDKTFARLNNAGRAALKTGTS